MVSDTSLRNGREVPEVPGNDPLSPEFTGAVTSSIADFLDARRPLLADIGPELAPLADQAALFLRGGKRLRPAFCWWAHLAAGGRPSAAVLTAAASLDLLHVSALVHDDLMDCSDLRRGIPAAHVTLSDLHSRSQWRGSAKIFGAAGAILLGDLLLMWSAEMFNDAGLDPTAHLAALPLLHLMRTEVTAGQYLDIVAQANPADADTALDQANRVVEYKSARYTVQRPAQIGAALAGAGPALQEALGDFGSHVGRAFQFRDDLLGVFGDEATTGKPVADDLREGKRTMLLAMALADLPAADAARLESLVGRADLDPQLLGDACDLIRASGAPDRLERLIDDHFEHAVAALETVDLTDEGGTALRRLADLALRRDH